MRQITSHLAYAITAGLNCDDIGSMSYIARQAGSLEEVFINRFLEITGTKLHLKLCSSCLSAAYDKPILGLSESRI